MSYDNSKQMVLSKVVSDNPKAPKLSIRFEIDGQKMKAGLWPMTRKDGSVVTDKAGNTLYKGYYEVDNWEPQQAPAKAVENEDVPF